jgi:arginine:ornithine antiporter/lysine permease
MENNPKSSVNSIQKIGFVSLIFLILNSVIGIAILNIPRNATKFGSGVTTLISWFIIGFGTFILIIGLTSLRKKYPTLNAGIIVYAEKSFGNFVAFLSCWGYLFGTLFSNVLVAYMADTALQTWFPIFNNRFVKFLFLAFVLIFMSVLISAGVKGSNYVNIVVTISKISIYVIFIVTCILFFHLHLFVSSFFSMKGVLDINGTGFTFQNIFTSVKNILPFLVFAFIGIEGAIVYSEKAKKQSDVSKATIVAFFIALCFFVVITLLPLGVLDKEQIINTPDPALSGIIGTIPGFFATINKTLINIGILLGTIGSLIPWTIYVSETIYQGAVAKLLPKKYTQLNKRQIATKGMFMATAIMILLLVIFTFSSSTYDFIYTVSASLYFIPYMIIGFCCIKELKNKAIGILLLLYVILLIFVSGFFYFVVLAYLCTAGIAYYLYFKMHDKGISLSNIYKNAKNINKILVGLFIIVDIFIAVYLIFQFLIH